MDIEVVFRLIFLIVFLLMFAISSVYRKRAREEGGVIERKAEGTVILVLRIALGLPLFLALILYGVYPKALAWSFVSVPPLVRWFFAGIAIACVPIIFWVFRSIGKNITETVLTKEGHELVRHGPYRWVRHPLYATALLMIGSTAFISTSWFLFAYFVAGVLVFRLLVVPEEEKRLIEAFGDDYRSYRKTTGALFPKIF